jgi:chromosome segregation ATPase
VALCKDVSGSGKSNRTSLIEYTLFFGIGFLVALFAAVVATPIVSRRAMRLALARVRMQTAMTDKLAAAEADSLLAMHAVELVRLEQRLAAAQDDAMGLRVKVGRQSVQISALESDAAEREGVIFEVRSEMDKCAAECRNLETAMAASQITLLDAFAQRDRAQSSEAAAKVRLGELESEASRDRARIAILVAQVENLGELLQYAEAAKEKAAKSFAELTSSLAGAQVRSAELEERLRNTISERQALRESLKRAEGGLEEGRRRLVELESHIRHSERAREEMLIENGRQLAALADRDTALRAAQAKADELEARFAVVGEETRLTESSGSMGAHKAVSAQAASALRAAHANPEALLRENEILRGRISMLDGARDQAGDVALRKSIEHLGREVNRLYVGQKHIDQDAGGPRERMLSGRQEGAAIVGPANAETQGLVDAPRRRAAASRTLDR